ncbi:MULTISPECIES: peptidase domain-containing ABC transporter [Gilliamella]|nr:MULTISPECIES: peptidase domain-containing ABC transporter [Gilliamella]
MKNKLNLTFISKKKLPILLQSELSECGLACLGMIAQYWGIEFSLRELRQKYPFTLRGASLKNIMDIAIDLKFNCRPIKLDLNNLKNLVCPCILHWNLNHFVVLKKVKGNTAYIHDPAIGKIKLKLEDVSKCFTGIAIELIPSSSFSPQKTSSKISLRSVMGNVVGLNKGLIQLFILGIMIQICMLISPLYLQWVVDDVIAVSDKNLLTVLGIGFILLALLRVFIEIVRDWFITVFSTQLNYQWRGNVLNHLLNLPLEWFQRRSLADILSRFHSIQEIQDGITTKVVASLVDGMLVITTFIMMFLYNTTLAMISFLSIFIYALLRWFAFDLQKNLISEYIINQAHQESHFLESMKGMQTIRLYNYEKERAIKWMNLSAKEYNAHLRKEKYSLLINFANKLIFSLDKIIIIWFASTLILNATFSIGMLFAFVSYKEQFTDRIISLIDKISDILMLRIHVERLADIVLSQTENTSKTNPLLEKNITLDLVIKLDNVSFRYSPNEPFVLNKINLSIPMGQCLAITGASGCGKTTLMKIILGLLPPTEGEIFIGDIPLSTIDKKAYRKLIATVMQEDNLFTGTIAENICFFESAPNFEEIEKCAIDAAIHDEIINMPMNYNTLIGDIGTGLSGGQKQRILLARALYRKPQILALDEATSHLDISNEIAVNNSMSRYNFTKIVIAHRQETINASDRIIVLNNGIIVSDTLK